MSSKRFTDREFTSKQGLWSFLKRIFSYALKYKLYFWGMILTVSLAAATDTAFPLIWLNLIDNYLTPAMSNSGAREVDWSGIYVYIWYYAGAIVSVSVNVALCIYFTGRLKEHVMYDLRKDMFDRLQHLSHSFYDTTATGWITIRLTSDTDKVSQVISWGFLSLIWGSVMIIASVIFMLMYSVVLTLIIVLIIPLLVFLAIRVRLLVLDHSRKARKLYSEMAANLTENINGVEVNKATVQEQKASRNFMTITGNLQKSSFRSSYFMALYNPMVVMAGSIAAAMVVFWGGNLALDNSMGVTLGVLAAFFAYARMIFDPVFEVAYYYATTQDSLSAGERIFSLIDEPIQIKDQSGVDDFGNIQGEIRLDQVYFHYEENKPIIQNLNLHIQAGESIALVGPTGEGKSTIANLICRFYEPVKGSILIDGQEYTQKTLHSFRSQLGVILQNPHLFSGTIRDNIRYGKLAASDTEIIKALQLIGAEQFIDRLDEEVGEEGSLLSLGEKQLLSFARSIVKDPRILVMDEATSSVDTLTEAKIQQGVEQLIQGRTAIIIAHRLSTIKKCDRILVISKGSILEEGNHAQLMQRKGKYYQLYTGQANSVLV